MHALYLYARERRGAHRTMHQHQWEWGSGMRDAKNHESVAVGPHGGGGRGTYASPRSRAQGLRGWPSAGSGCAQVIRI